MRSTIFQVFHDLGSGPEKGPKPALWFAPAMKKLADLAACPREPDNGVAIGFYETHRIPFCSRHTQKEESPTGDSRHSARLYP